MIKPLLLLLIGLPLLQEKPGWWDPDWAFRRTISIKNNLPGALAPGFQYGVDIDATRLNIVARCRPGLEDLVVVHDGKQVPHAILPGIGEGRLVAWFRIQKEIPKGGRDGGYALYFGNRGQDTSTAKPRDVFEFSDDFSAAAIDDKRWTIEGGAAVTVDKGQMVITDVLAARSERTPARIVLKAPVPRGFAVTADIDYQPAAGAAFTFAAAVEFKDEAADAPGMAQRIGELVDKLGDGDPDTREVAMKELVKIGKPALKLLIDASQSGDAEVRFRADQAINDIYAAHPPQIVQAGFRAGEASGGSSRIATIGKARHVFAGAVPGKTKMTLSILRDEEGDVTVLWNGLKPDSGVMKGDVREFSFLAWRSLEVPMGRVGIDNVVIRRHMQEFTRPTHVLGAEESRP